MSPGPTGSLGTEIWFDDRAAVLGANGSGKSSFLWLLDLESYQGTVLAVTHDRWFARSLERFLVFTS